MKYEHYTRPCVEDIFAGKESKYALAIAVAKRARQITDDMQNDTGKVYDKPVLVAVDEFADNKYAILEPDIDD
ncbi:MAG: DNA-directed RNA polymerase subunit omega [Clostridia bacterium]|nr:DNA-directed RNA polymerase subunit omega [Clostridia bacterium]